MSREAAVRRSIPLAVRRGIGLLVTLSAMALPSVGGAQTVVWYQGTSTGSQSSAAGTVDVGPDYLSNRTTASGGGTAATPWNKPAGDYCDSYEVANMYARPGVNGGVDTGFTTPTPYRSYQWGSSALSQGVGMCQASGDEWGQWIDPTVVTDCNSAWCGVQHAVSFGQDSAYLPWGQTPATDDALLVESTYEPYVYNYLHNVSGANDAWGYLCAVLEDDSTDQRLEYCLNEWSTWGAPPDQITTIFYNTLIKQWFTNVGTNFDPGTKFATEAPGSDNTIAGPGATGFTQTYAAEITYSDLANTVADINAEITSEYGSCHAKASTTVPACYSTNPANYQLMGLENGQELLGRNNYLGGNDMITEAATEESGGASSSSQPAAGPFTFAGSAPEEPPVSDVPLTKPPTAAQIRTMQ